MRWDAAWHQRLTRILIDLPFRSAEEQAAIRRELGRDPVAFALIYFRHHLRGKETGDRITFSETHYEWASRAERWALPVTEPMEQRDAEIAPRAMGKSTWWFLLLPVWAAANEYLRFIAAFAHTPGQAEGHLETMRNEFENNALLRHDYPDLCRPAKRQRGGTVADRQGMIRQANGFTFAARGIDAASLGLKVNETRPDCLILDDVEPDEANYSVYLAKKRLGTVRDAIFPLNIYARVVMVGTVTMPGSVTHQLIRSLNRYRIPSATVDEELAWIEEERITVHHTRAIAINEDGTERSVWPEKWPLAWLQSRRHTREYAKNYDNDPMARDGVYWTRDDFPRGSLDTATRWLLQIDPAVTAKQTSDFTGVAIIGYSPVEHKCVVRFARGVRMTGEPLRQYVVTLLGMHPEVKAVRIETVQGGALWLDIMHHLPGVKVLTHGASASKEVRFADALRHWQNGDVLHEEDFPVFREQAVGFPRVAYDDVVDAVAAGVSYFMSTPKRKPRADTVHSYA